MKQSDTVGEVGRDHGPWDVGIPKRTDGHGRTVKLEYDLDHVRKVDLEDRSAVESYHEDRKGVEDYHEYRSVLASRHQCNSVQHDDGTAVRE